MNSLIAPVSAYRLWWLVCAGAAGLVLASQPVPISVGLMALVAAAIAAAVTPLAALVAMLVFAPMRTLIATEASFPLPLDIGQWLLISLIVFWIVQQFSQRRAFQFAPSPIYVPVAGFFLAVSATAWSALSMSAWLSEWLKWAQILLLIFLVMHLGTGKRWEWIVFGLTLSGVANGVIGIYEYFGGSGALHLLINGDKFRAFGTFGQPNPFGGFMGLLAPIALMALLGYSLVCWQRWRSGKPMQFQHLLPVIYYAFASAILVMGLVMSWSRGAWLGFGVSLFAVAFALPRRVLTSIALVSIIALLVGLLWSTGRLPASITARINSATEELFAFNDVRGVDINPENYAVVERLAHWQAALNMTRAQPWLGIGMGNYEVAYPYYRLINWKFPLGHAHNYYLNVLAEAGIIGLISYVALWISVFLLTWRARQHPNVLARSIVIGLLGTWTYLSVHSLTDNLYVNNLFLHVGVMLGTLAALHHQTYTHLRSL